jgi:hypothetical protein
MDNANTGAPTGAPLARLRGIKGWGTGVIQADGQRWVTFALDWLDGGESIAVTFDPADAQAIAKTLFYAAKQAEARDAGDRN